jgi:hypothetical protein
MKPLHLSNRILRALQLQAFYADVLSKAAADNVDRATRALHEHRASDPLQVLNPVQADIEERADHTFQTWNTGRRQLETEITAAAIEANRLDGMARHARAKQLLLQRILGRIAD